MDDQSKKRLVEDYIVPAVEKKIAEFKEGIFVFMRELQDRVEELELKNERDGR